MFSLFDIWHWRYILEINLLVDLGGYLFSVLTYHNNKAQYI